MQRGDWVQILTESGDRVITTGQAREVDRFGNVRVRDKRLHGKFWPREQVKLAPAHELYAAALRHGVLVVAHAACRDPAGVVHQVPRPCRHHHVLWLLHWSGVARCDLRDQGFVLSDGRYVGRREARVVAEAAHQLLPRASSLAELYSEDVW